MHPKTKIALSIAGFGGLFYLCLGLLSRYFHFRYTDFRIIVTGVFLMVGAFILMTGKPRDPEADAVAKKIRTGTQTRNIFLKVYNYFLNDHRKWTEKLEWNRTPGSSRIIGAGGSPEFSALVSTIGVFVFSLILLFVLSGFAYRYVCALLATF